MPRFVHLSLSQHKAAGRYTYFLLKNCLDIQYIRGENNQGSFIELNQDIPAAIALINRIRTERADVKISTLPSSLSQSEARQKLRHERRSNLRSKDYIGRI